VALSHSDPTTATRPSVPTPDPDDTPGPPMRTGRSRPTQGQASATPSPAASLAPAHRARPRGSAGASVIDPPVLEADALTTMGYAGAVPLVVDAIPLPAAHPTLAPMEATHLRRCTFRRVTLLQTASRHSQPFDAGYRAECLFRGHDAPVALGDLSAARPTCAECVFPHIFRADED